MLYLEAVLSSNRHGTSRHACNVPFAFYPMFKSRLRGYIGFVSSPIHDPGYNTAFQKLHQWYINRSYILNESTTKEKLKKKDRHKLSRTAWQKRQYTATNCLMTTATIHIGSRCACSGGESIFWSRFVVNGLANETQYRSATPNQSYHCFALSSL